MCMFFLHNTYSFVSVPTNDATVDKKKTILKVLIYFTFNEITT